MRIVRSLEYDLRVPSGATRGVDTYAAALAQCEWADRLGFDEVVLHEHHVTADGYLPSPIVFAAAIAARTTGLRLHLGVLIAPLYDPIRLAEDLAVLDLVSAGRIRVSIGAGYRPIEFDAMGAEISRRASKVEEVVDVLKQAWTGESFEYEGHAVQVLPTPAQRPRPDIYLGGTVPAAARRAARIADGFWPGVPDVYEDYLAELRRLGKPLPQDEGRPHLAGSIGCYAGRGMVHVAEDVDAAWERVAPYALHDAREYANYFAEAGMPKSIYAGIKTLEDLKASNLYEVLTPARAVERARQIGGVNLHPLVGGMDPELGWESLRLVEEKVLPRLA